MVVKGQGRDSVLVLDRSQHGRLLAASAEVVESAAAFRKMIKASLPLGYYYPSVRELVPHGAEVRASTCHPSGPRLVSPSPTIASLKPAHPLKHYHRSRARPNVGHVA